MADYQKSTDFASKDLLPTGDPNKVVVGAEIDQEFEDIETAIITKADIHNETHTGDHTFTANVDITGTLVAGLIDGGTF